MSELINAMMAANAGLSEEGVDHRARSISINAIREMRVAIGRDAGPWTDADSRLQNAIYLVLKRMDKVKVGESDDGSFPLVSPQPIYSQPDDCGCREGSNKRREVG